MHGPFRIVGVLGKGGMATVYEAYEAPLERVVALKVLPAALMHDGTFANRFNLEARLEARLEHPNIVPVYASGIDAGLPWMSMRLLDGGSLSDLIGPEGLSIEHTIRILRSVAEALDYAHASGVVHRDLKPSNILLDRSNRVYIADFGLAFLLEGHEELTRSGTILGTPHYMAPEQGLGQDVDHRCDLYSLGVIAYEMLTGTTPFRGSSPIALLMQHATDPVPVPPRALVPDAQFAVLRKALAKKAEQRWQSGGEFVAALESSTREGTNAWIAVVFRWAWVSAATSLAVLLLWLALTLKPTTERGSTPPKITAPVANPGPPVDVQRNDPTTVKAEGETRAKSPPVRPTTPPNSSKKSEPREPSAAAKNETIAPALDTRPAEKTEEDTATQATDGPPPDAVVNVNPPVVPGPVAEQASDVITNPDRIGTIKPDYPRNALAAKIQGDVVLQAMILPDGRVSQVRILSSPNSALNDAAIRAVQQSTYKPGLRNGMPGTFSVEVTVTFRLPSGRRD